MVQLPTDLANTDLFGHKSHRITAHYLKAEIDHLLAAAEKVVSNRNQPLF